MTQEETQMILACNTPPTLRQVIEQKIRHVDLDRERIENQIKEIEENLRTLEWQTNATVAAFLRSEQSLDVAMIELLTPSSRAIAENARNSAKSNIRLLRETFEGDMRASLGQIDDELKNREIQLEQVMKLRSSLCAKLKKIPH